MKSEDGVFLTTFILVIFAGLFFQVLAAENIFYTTVKETITLENGKIATIEVEHPNTTLQIFQNISLYWLVMLLIAFVLSGLAYISISESE